ncbi:MAG: hypothetical protein ACXVEF_27450 [Polyangiales bacterium]
MRLPVLFAILSLLGLGGCANRLPASGTSPRNELRCNGSEMLAIGDDGRLLRGDGSSWQAIETPSSRPLRAIWGTSCKDVWAVGDDGTIVWGDGRDFWLVPSPNAVTLTSVYGTSHDDVWAVTEAGTHLHFDGKEWTVVEGERLVASQKTH